MSLLIRSRQSVEKARWGLCRQTVDKATAHYFIQITPPPLLLKASITWEGESSLNPHSVIHVADTHAAALRWSWPPSPVTLYTTAEPVKGTSSSDLAAVCWNTSAMLKYRGARFYLWFLQQTNSNFVTQNRGPMKETYRHHYRYWHHCTVKCGFICFNWSVFSHQTWKCSLKLTLFLFLNVLSRWGIMMCMGGWQIFISVTPDSVKNSRICLHMHRTLSCCSRSGHIFDVAGQITSVSRPILLTPVAKSRPVFRSWKFCFPGNCNIKQVCADFNW